MNEALRLRWLTVFGYSPQWFDAGLLTEDRLRSQIEAWEQPGADHHPEHVRYATWRAHLATLVEFPTERLETLLALDLREASLRGSNVSSFGHGIAHDLAKHPALTVEGLARLRRHPVTDASFTRALDAARQRLEANHSRRGRAE